MPIKVKHCQKIINLTEEYEDDFKIRRQLISKSLCLMGGLIFSHVKSVYYISQNRSAMVRILVVLSTIISLWQLRIVVLGIFLSKPSFSAFPWQLPPPQSPCQFFASPTPLFSEQRKLIYQLLILIPSCPKWRAKTIKNLGFTVLKLAALSTRAKVFKTVGAALQSYKYGFHFN